MKLKEISYKVAGYNVTIYPKGEFFAPKGWRNASINGSGVGAKKNLAALKANLVTRIHEMMNYLLERLREALPPVEKARWELERRIREHGTEKALDTYRVKE